MAGLIRAALLAALAFASLAQSANAADAGWFAAGDLQMRSDLTLLNDAEIIRLPVTQWPIPRAAVRYALANAKPHLATNAAVEVALQRVRARTGNDPHADRSSFSLDAWAGVGEAGLLRDFNSQGREDAELGGRATYASGRVEVQVDLTAVTSPADDQQIRADGSHATVALGNWLLSANTLDRWWGPGHTGSLILSNNARPIPAVTVERTEARPFESDWLRWVGPWRFTFGVGRMENERDDIDSPLFMSWRVVIMPLKRLEIGFSRTAQFCGEQLVCDVDSFFNMLAGNDNVGIDATPENEPGNQMAGFDMRWASPIGNLPYAIYSQMIGEDESSYLPAKYLAQHGFEVWKPVADGAVLQMYAEYATTTCSASTGRGPYYNCAYNQGRFNGAGYRYRGRVIGYTTDRDAENYALGATLTRADGTAWFATARTSRLNRDDSKDVRNTVSSVPADFDSIEAGWRGSLLGGSLNVNIGIESLAPAGGDREIDPFGFISWRREIKP